MSFAREGSPQRMSKLRFNISMSLDGFVAGPDPSEQDPLGKRGEELHEWILPLAAFREPHGRTREARSTRARRWSKDGRRTSAHPSWAGTCSGAALALGASLRGRAGGETTRPSVSPVFVLTHHARDPLELKGGTTFHFVTDGIESALEQARDAAGGKDVSLAGGADVAQQYLAAGLIDEMEIAIVPVMLGGGTRLFENLGDPGLELSQVQAVEAPGVVHLKYRVGS